MDPFRLGRAIRALRHRLDLRQSDVAALAGVDQSVVSDIEAGRLGSVRVAAVHAVAAAVGAELVQSLRWRGGELDRLLDEGHAALVGAGAVLLERLSWATAPEVSFAVYRESGSIDLLALHGPSQSLLVVEVKTELTSVEEMLRRHDVKSRLAARVARERLGWDARTVSRLLVLPDASTPRRRVARHGAVLDRAYPLRGTDARAWLRTPTGAVGALLFLSSMAGGHGRNGPVTRRRVRRAQPSSPTAADAGRDAPTKSPRHG